MKIGLTTLLGAILYVCLSFVIFFFTSLEVGGMPSSGSFKRDYSEDILMVVLLLGMLAGLVGFIRGAIITQVPKGKWFLIPPAVAILCLLINTTIDLHAGDRSSIKDIKNPSVYLDKEVAPQVESVEPSLVQVENFSPVTLLNGSASPAVFKEYENTELGVSFSYPEDWLMYRNNEGHYNYPETTLLVVHEDSIDPTVVHIKLLPISLSDVLETTERTSPSSDPKKWNAASTTLQETEWEGVKVLRRVQYGGKNKCAAIDYFHPISENKTGVVEVSGVCASHAPGYDALKVKVAESVRFI